MEPGWTLETLRIYLEAIMDERDKAAREAVKIALEAVRAEQTHRSTLAVLIAGIVAALIQLVMGHK
jgi:hypothetical protein